MAARKEKWELVKKNIDNGNIQEWAKTMNERQIASACGVCMAAFSNYKNKYPELTEAIQEGRQALCEVLKSNLIKKATGFKTEKVKTYVKDDGTNKVEIIEKTEEEIPPDVGAIHLLLKNYDETWHNDDTKTLEIKMNDVDFKKKEHIAKYLLK